MKIRSIILVFTFYSVVAVGISCKQSNKQVFYNKSSDTTVHVTNIPISELGKNYKSYHGKYIETTGRFYRAFEVCCLGPLPNDSADIISFFWLHIHEDLNNSIPSIAKTKERIVTIKGRIDTTHKGHMGFYPATIDNIFYWEEEKIK